MIYTTTTTTTIDWNKISTKYGILMMTTTTDQNNNSNKINMDTPRINYIKLL